MRRVAIAGLGIGLVAVGWWAGAHHSTASADARPTPVRGGVGPQHARDGRVAPGDTGGDAEEVAALRAQLRDRDKLLGAIAVRGVLAQQAGGDPRPGEPPTARAIGKLNERLSGGDATQPDARAAKAALELATHELPRSLNATVDCSSELCRVTVEGDADQLDRESTRMLERLPKRFAGTLVLPDGEGRRVVFAATRPELLSLRDEPAETLQGDK